MHIEDPDFSAVFEDGKWIVKWKWNEKVDCLDSVVDQDMTLPILRNKVSQYPPSESIREEFDREIEKWIENGWLRLCDGPYDGVVPLHSGA